jgi:O-antigen/teichoic acid export membrane protein
MSEGSATKKIARNYSWLLSGSLISGAANFFTNVYIARVLGVNAFGLFKFAQAFLNYLILLVDSGLSTLGTIEIAKDKKSVWPITLNLMALRLLLALTAFILAVLVMLLLPITWELRALFACTFLYVFYRALNLDWAFQGLEEMGFIAVAKVMYAVLFLLSMLYLVRSAGDLLRVPFLQSLAGLVTAIIFLLIFLKRTPNRDPEAVDRKKMTDYLWQSAPLGLSAFLVQIYNNLDSIMLGVISGSVVVGYYNAAYQVYYLCLAFFILWQSTAIPVASSKLNEDRAKAEQFLTKYLRLTMLAVVPAVIAVYFAAPLAVKLLYGNTYQEAGMALRWLIWTMIPCAVGYTYGSLLLIPSGNSRGFLAAVAGGALVNLVLNFLLIPHYGYAGAAVATIAAEATVALIGIRLARTIIRLPLPAILAKPAFFALAAVMPVWFIPLSTLAKGISFLGIYLVLALLWERTFVLSFIREVIKRS